MRRSLLLAFASGALGVGVACASSDEIDAQPPTPDSDSGLPPADSAVHDAEVDATLEPPTCSAAGWCITTLPDLDLVLKDIWPLPGHAFAIAESRTLGLRFLEWDEASATWSYIDDGTQNETGLGKYAGRMWASDENDVYFSLAPGTIYHGTRGVPPSTGWTWTRHRLEDNSPDQSPSDDHGYPTYLQLIFGYQSQPYPALGVWGTARDDVYAWYSNTIYHWTTVDGGTPGWVAEYIADDVDVASEHLYVLSAAGTSRDNVWFSLARDRLWDGSCAVVVRKTPAGYERIADGVVTDGTCGDRAGVAKLNGADGWLTDLQEQSPNRFVGLKGTRDVVRITAEGGTYSFAAAPVPAKVAMTALISLWSAPDDQLWSSGWALVVRGADVWDGGAFQISTLSLNGAPLDWPMYRIRGSSNTNLWAIGIRNALHKTTP